MPRISSTTTPLAANGTWSSGQLQAELSDTITGSVFADQAGTIFIEQSGDGTNWDISTSYAVTANNGKGIQESILLPYLQIRYVNGASAQGAFRIHTRMTSAGPR